jgi:membrane associated rhomboid family serine protease
MFFPLGTEVRLRRPTLVTYVLMALCVFAFIGQEYMNARTDWSGAGAMSFEPPGYYRFMLYGTEGSIERVLREFAEATSGERDVVFLNTSRWYQYITYQFLHGGWLHLGGNLLFLFVFGPPVEDRLRRSGFLAFYLLGGVIAGLAHGALQVETVHYDGIDYRTVAPVLGASGSIAAVTGAYLVLFPLAPVRVLTIIPLFGRSFIKGWVFVLISVAFDLFFVSFGVRNGVANFAHLGGYLGGAAIAMLLLWRNVIARQPYDLFSMARQAHRRRQYRELVAKGPAASPYVKEAAMKRQAVAKAKADPHGEVRREIVSLSSRDAPAAAEKYLELLREDEKCVLTRDAQLAIANALFQKGDHQNAMEAYERFLDKYPDDREADQTRLMGAMIATRQLNDPVGATKLLDAIDREYLDESLAGLYETLREELS